MHGSPPLRRPRWATGAALLGVIGLGLASRADWMPPGLFAEHAGDALWAVAVYLGWILLFPTWRPQRAALLAALVCIVVECQQLIDVPWLVQARGTLPGRLLLGSGFLWMDFVRYGMGVLAAFGLDRLWVGRLSP